MCLRFVFLLITRLAAWLRLSRREEVLRQAWEAEQGVGDTARPLRGQKVAVVDAPVLVDELHPAGRESLERVDLLGVDLVSDVTGDHVGLLGSPNAMASQVGLESRVHCDICS